MQHADRIEKIADDIFEKIKLDVFDGIDLDVFDAIEAPKLKQYVSPPKVSLSLSDEIRTLIKTEIDGLMKEAVTDAVKRIKPRTVETKTIERVVEKTLPPPPEKVIVKEKFDESKLLKRIDEKIKKALDEAPLFIPAPPILPSMSSQSGKVLSNDGNQPRWITPAASSSGGGTSSDAYVAANVSTDRSFDANSTSIDELADVLGSLIASLQGAGIIQ